MSSYTGPVTVVIFKSVANPKDRFALTFHVNEDDPESVKKIVARYKEDGYEPEPKSRQWYMVNGSIEGERTPGVRLGFRARSAFLRA